MTTNAVAHGADPSIGKSFRSRTLAVLALTFLAFSAGPVRTQAASETKVDCNVFLKAVAQVETGGNARAIGRLGERGLYQFTRTTWRRYSKRPFVDAHHPAIAYDVAVRHFNWLHERLVANGAEPTMHRMAVAWNAGLSRALSGRPPRSTHDYARRVANLAAQYRPSSRTLAAAAPVRATVNRAPVVVTTASTPAPLNFAFEESSGSEVTPLTFSLNQGTMLADSAPVVEAVEAPEVEITFSLASPTGAAKPAPSSSSRRLIFATIGE